MRLKLCLSGLSRESKQDQPFLLIPSYTLGMCIRNLPQYTGQHNAPATGLIPVSDLDAVLEQLEVFRNGLCGLDEQHSLVLLEAMLKWAKRYEYAIKWSLA